MKKVVSILFITLICAALGSGAFSAPRFDGHVCDAAGVLSEDAKGEIDELSVALGQKNGTHVYVLCADQTDGLSMRDFSRGVLASLEDQESSALLVLFPEGGDYYACVGGGLSEYVSYDDIKEILSVSTEGAFSSGNYDAASVSFAQAFASRLASIDRSEKSGGSFGHTLLIILLVLFIAAVLFFAVVYIIRTVNINRARRRRAGRRRPLR